jgi:hypothetical protein
MPQIHSNCNIPGFVPNAANLFRDKASAVSTDPNFRTMSRNCDIMNSTGITIMKRTCRFCFDESDDEDSVVVVLLCCLTANSTRITFCPSREYPEVAVCENMAQSIRL